MTNLLTNSNVQQLTERICDWHSEEVAVDLKSRLVRNVALAGQESKNGYRYTEESLLAAVALYANKPVFLDHAANQARPHQRSTRDLVGSVINPRFEQGRIRGDIQLLDTEAGRTFIALAETSSPAVGMSHVVLAERNADRTVVEKIHEVVSIDAVVFPATTSTFSESFQNQAVALTGSVETVLAEIDLMLQGHLHRLTGDSALVASRVGLFSEQLVVAMHATEQAVGSSSDKPEYFVLEWSLEEGVVVLGDELTAISASQLQENDWRAVQLAERQQVAKSEHEQLQQQLNQAIHDRTAIQNQIEKLAEEHQAAMAVYEVDQLLQESSLPESAIDDEFRNTLLDAREQKVQLQLIHERRQLVHRLTALQPNSWERSESSPQEISDAFVVNQLRGRALSILGN